MNSDLTERKKNCQKAGSFARFLRKSGGVIKLINTDFDRDFCQKKTILGGEGKWQTLFPTKQA